MGILAGKVAVITGGTRGLGFAIAQAFAQAGASVVAASRSQASVDEAVEQISTAGGKAAGMAVDVSNLDQVQALAEYAMYQFGRLDIWVNNAGIAGPYGPTMGYDPTTFTQVVQTNILGVYHGSRTAVWIASPATDGKTGLLVSSFTPWTLLGGALKEGFRSLRKQPAPGPEIHIKTVRHYQG